MEIGSRVDWCVVNSGNRQMEELPATIAQFPSARFADAREGAGEVSVIFERNQAVQSHDSEWSVLASLIAIFLVRAARSAQGIDDAFDAERFGLDQTNLFSLYVACLANPAAVGRVD